MVRLSALEPDAWLRLLRRAAIGLALALPAQGCGGATPAASAESEAAAARAALDIATKDGVRHFTVEIVTTPEAQAQGLMFRKTLAPDAGMLFVFGYDAPRSFWMKNTILPLDMIFIRSTGEIVAIVKDTVPYSLRPISPPEPAASVLEVNAGTADRLGIGLGDHVALPPAPR